MKGKIKKCGKRILAYVLVGAFVAGSIPAALPVNAAGSSFFEEPTTDNQDDGFFEDENVGTNDGQGFIDMTDDENTGGAEDDSFIDMTDDEDVDDENAGDDFIDMTDDESETMHQDGEDLADNQIDFTDEADTEASDVVFEAAAGDISLAISGNKEVMNGAESASIFELSDEEMDQYLDLVVTEENQQLLTIFDISLLDSAGGEVEPEGSVTVSLSGPAIANNIAKGNEISVVHILETNTLDRDMDSAGTDILSPEYTAEDTLAFETGSFSKYALVLTGNDSQKEVNFSGERYFEIDKYLSAPTGEVNGQNTYDTYLEHAYYDGAKPHQIINLAPASQDIILVLDQSASMAEARINAVNKSVETFLKNVMNINKSRMQIAKEGGYTDIDPEGDVEDQMEDHLMKITGVVGYNNRTYDKYHNPDGKAVLTDVDVNQLTKAAHIKNDYREYYENGRTDTDIQDCTRTDLALKKAESWINPDNYENTITVVLTDGAPYGWGPEGKVTYEYESSNLLMMTAQSSNAALQTARKMKDNGAHIYAVYLGYADVRELDNAFSSGRIEKVPCWSTHPSKHIASIFLTLMSSDYPKNGILGYTNKAQGEITYPFDYTYGYDADSRNHFGKYIYLPEKIDDLVQDVSSIPGRIDAAGSNNKREYAGATATAHDEVTDPFDIMDASEVRVYKVPRIPENLDEEGIPTDADEDGIVTNLRWGEQYITEGSSVTSEWIDITDDPRISVSVKGNIVEVTGFDYEENAVTDYDKDLYKPRIPKDAAVYKPGDYGYKLVVVVPICSKVTFGGNAVQTNNSDTSAFFPGDPVGYQDTNPDGENYLPRWEENTELNPDGNKYIEKYPVPQVDLKVNYKIPSDNLLIYAPQTAELANLVTDQYNNMWYVDGQYSSLKTIRDNAYDDMQRAYDAYAAAQKDAKADPENQEKLKEVAVKLVAYEEAKAEYETAQENFETVESYIPNGINNAFVNISYQLKDPDGVVVGTLEIPHGKAYVLKNGIGNIEWTFTGGKNATATKSGTYSIECTITPVDTVRAPGGHVSTEADSEAVQESIPYKSTEYSSTGSSASGSQTSVTVSQKPTAHIFQLQITAADSRLRKNQALDFNQGNENLIKTENPHIVEYEWVCTDGVTESRKEDEPGINGSLKLGSGVTVTCQIPQAAVEEGKVKDIDGTTVVNVDDGQWVPVSVLLSRNIGNLNKSVSDKEQVEQKLAYMREDDGIYGGASSVIWNHDCTYVTGCTDNEFAQAQDYNTPEDETGRGAVRYLIHVLDNPLPDISKDTSTPGITKGEDIKWNISLSNANEAKNPKHRSSDSTMVDILPYIDDGRIDPSTNNEGSDFSGDLYYRSITVNFEEDGEALEAYKSGKAKMYYTTDKAVRTASESQILGDAKEGNIVWQEMSGSLDGNTLTVTGCPDTAVAIRMDTSLAWREKVGFDLVANLRNLSDQQAGDRYHNQAFVTNGNGIKNSEVAVTTVTNLYVSGTIWEDYNGNNLMDSSETKVKDIVVTLYRASSANNNDPVDRTVNGVKLVRAYDTNGDKFVPVLTMEDGTFLFDDIPAGTYYIIADYIPKEYEMVEKQAGKDDPNSAKIDSEAEQKILTPADEDEEKMANSAWIKEVVVSDKGVPDQNYGLKSIRGSVRVGKMLDEIYYPSSMTEEERDSYKVSFTFKMKNTDTGRTYTEAMTLDKNTIHGSEGKPSVWVTFKDLPLGTYELTEVHNAQYTVDDVESDSSNVKYDSGSSIITIPVTPGEFDFEIAVSNRLIKDPPGGDQNGVRNWLNMHIPVKLEVKYVGPDPISDKKLTQYTFTENDFDPRKGGDIIVTYDDGTTISLSEKTLRFDQLTFSPSTVTSTMNSGDPNKDKIPVTVYYSEKGRTVTDSFRVAVDLKPIHKFQLNFDANGSTFDDGSTKNSVMFGYDEETNSNFITSGIYKDIKNAGLNGRGTDYTFAGWNTRDDGSGIQYSNLDALNAIGADTGISSLTLYANWKTNVTFDANGGILAGGTTDDEKALAGKASGTIPYNVNQTIATGLTGNRKNYTYVLWNTKPDGTGTNIEDYGKVTGPVTFYAIYYQSEYYYTGTEQTFQTPVDGWYKVQLWGAQGGRDASNQGGKGAYVSGEVHVTAGTKLYVYVGAPGANNTHGTGAGYNGGGNSGANSGGSSGSGGGATDIRISSGNWTEGLSSRIAVAAGGGGAGVHSGGGYGGALVGGNSNKQSGGTQTKAGNRGSFGVGGSSQIDGGGGGGGWYGGGASSGGGLGDERNDVGGGGGSSYMSGFPGCEVSWTGYVFRNPQMIAGNQQMPAPDGGYETGHAGACRARIQLISID